MNAWGERKISNMKFGNDNSIIFEKEDLLQFAEYSGDRNPLHIDESYADVTVYREPVVYGMLGAIVLLNFFEDEKGQFHINFNMPLFLNRKYYLRRESKNGTTFLHLMDNCNKLISIKFERDNKKIFDEEKSLDKAEVWIPMLNKAQIYSDKEIETINTVEGVYQCGKENENYKLDNSILTRVLGFCSYAVGMVIPGERALFMRAAVSLAENDLKEDFFTYRISKVNYNNIFGIIENRIEIWCDNKLVAECKVQAYIRGDFSLNHMDIACVSDKLKDKKVVIIGGTKGIGASLARKYVGMGATVLLTYYHNEQTAQNLLMELKMISDKVELIRGDMGSCDDCERLKNYLADKYGSIDTLVLCAAYPTKNLDFSIEMYENIEEYLDKGMRIFYYPFYSLQTLISNNGELIALSSIAVKNKKDAYKMLDYICVKSMIENVMECEYYKNIKSEKKYYIVRPPKMLTEMNNTPIGRINAKNPAIIADGIISKIEELEEGKIKFGIIELE